jgi:hypothetical protein
METPKLIIEWDGENPAKTMCNICRAIFPALTPNVADSNKRILESAFQDHVRAEHSNQPPPWESAA